MGDDIELELRASKSDLTRFLLVQSNGCHEGGCREHSLGTVFIPAESTVLCRKTIELADAHIHLVGVCATPNLTTVL